MPRVTLRRHPVHEIPLLELHVLPIERFVNVQLQVLQLQNDFF